MAQIFSTGFDHYSTVALCIEEFGLGVSTGLSIGAYGRHGTQGLRIYAGGVSQTTGYVQLALANLATSTVGFALAGTGTDRPVVRWMDNATEQCSLWLRSDGRLEARGPTGLLAVGSAVFSPSALRFVEVKVTISDAAGRIQVQVDQPSGSTTYDIDTGGGGVDTKATANAYATAFRLGYGLGSAETTSYDYWFDDVRVFDAAGGALDTFAGDARVETLIANAAGSSTQWTPSAGSNYQCVDDASPDEDTSYVSSSTVGQLDRYALPSLVTTAGTVLSVTSWSRAKKDNSGARTLHNHLYLSTAGVPTQESGDLLPSTSYGWHESIHRLDGDGAAWSVTKVNALEVGVEVQA